MKIIKKNYHDILTKTICKPDGNFYLTIGHSFILDLEQGTLESDSDYSPLELFEKVKLNYKYSPVLDEVYVKNKAEVLSLCNYTVNKKSDLNGFVTLGIGDVEKSIHINSNAPVEEHGNFIVFPIEPKNSDYICTSVKNSVYTQNNKSYVNGFWPLPPDCKERTAYLEPFDSDWLKNHWPHLPTHANEFFQRSSSDQWLNGYITGGENIRIINASDKYNTIQCIIPKCKPRIFVEKLIADQKNFVELDSNIDTLWLLPDVMKAVLIAHGQVIANDSTASNISVVYADVDDFDNQLSVEQHYVNSGIPIKIDNPRNDQSIDNNEITSNEAIPEVDLTQQAQLNINNIDFENPYSEQKQPEIDGFDIFDQSLLSISDKDDFPSTIFPESFMNNMNEMNIQSNSLSLDQLMQAVNDNAKQFFELLKKSGITEEKLLEAANNLENLKDHANVLKNFPGGIAGIVDDFKSTIESFNHDKPPIQSSANESDENLISECTEQVNFVDNDQISREYIQSHYKTGYIYDSLDLSGLDLSGLKLDGVVFLNCNLYKTDFSNSTLTGVKFDTVCADEADFAFCNLNYAFISSSSFVLVNFYNALCENSVFKDVNLSKSVFNYANLSGSNLDSCDLSYTDFKNVNAELIIADNCNFSESDLTNSFLLKGRFRKSIFFKTNLTDCNFTLSNCTQADFSSSIANRTIFVESILCESQINQNANFVGVNFFKSDITNSNCCDSVFEGVNFDLSIIKDTDFSRSKIHNSSMINVLAHGAIFDFTMLSRSNFTGINLLKGAIRGATLQECNFELSNLFAVDFQDTKLNNVLLDGADVSRTILHFRQ